MALILTLSLNLLLIIKTWTNYYNPLHSSKPHLNLRQPNFNLHRPQIYKIRFQHCLPINCASLRRALSSCMFSHRSSSSSVWTSKSRKESSKSIEWEIRWTVAWRLKIEDQMLTWIVPLRAVKWREDSIERALNALISNKT